MCRLWRFLKGAVTFRWSFTMAATTAKTDGTEGSGGSAPGTDERDVKKPKVTNIDPVANPENSPKSPLEPTNNPPPDTMERIDDEPSGNDVERGKDNNPKEPVNNPPPDMTEPINRPPVTNVESWKIAGSNKNKNKGKNKPKTLDFSKMPLEEKRSHYRCGHNYITLGEILPWPDYVKHNHDWFINIGFLERDAEFTSANDHENRKISLWQGDITCLEIDAIVNAANRSLRGGGGVDGCIHRAAGRGLLEECIKLHGCETGESKITSGQKLPAKHVIHTVGPIGEKEKLLKSCYISCLTLMKEHKLSSMAFCSISTGIYGYPNRKAARVALKTVKSWLEDNKDWVGRIIFCVFLQDDLEVYQKLMLEYFPCTVEKKKVKSETSGGDDDTVASKREPKASTTVGEKPHRSIGRGRGRGARNTNTSENPPKPTLLSFVASNEDKIKGNHSEGEGSSPTVESKGHGGNAGSSFRESKDVIADENKMDTSEGDRGDAATVGSETPEPPADKKETEETSKKDIADAKCVETLPTDEKNMDTSEGGDTGDAATVGAKTPETTADKKENEEATKKDIADAKCKESDAPDEKKMDTSESGDTGDAATVGAETPETTADKKENEEATKKDIADAKCKESDAPDEKKMHTSERGTGNAATVGGETPKAKADKKDEGTTKNDSAEGKCVETDPSDDLDGDSGENGEPDNRGSSEDTLKISTADARESSQPESMETDETNEETAASLALRKSEMIDEKEGFQEGEGSTINDGSDEGERSVVKRKKKRVVKITSKV